MSSVQETAMKLVRQVERELEETLIGCMAAGVPASCVQLNYLPREYTGFAVTQNVQIVFINTDGL